MTKADAIRRMDNMQLADFLCCLVNGKCDKCPFGKCDTECAAMKYLKQEVKEGERLL